MSTDEPGVSGSSSSRRAGVHCMAPGCTNWFYKESVKSKAITYHRLPRDELQRKRWLQVMKLVKPPTVESARVCSEHFVDADYRRQVTRDAGGHEQTVRSAYLLKDVVPSIFDFTGYRYGETDSRREKAYDPKRAARSKRRSDVREPNSKSRIISVSNKEEANKTSYLFNLCNPMIII